MTRVQGMTSVKKQERSPEVQHAMAIINPALPHESCTKQTRTLLGRLQVFLVARTFRPDGVRKVCFGLQKEY